MKRLKKLISDAVLSLQSEETWAAIPVLLAASVAPNIFPVAQAGIAKMSDLAIWFLFPSLFLFAMALVYAWMRRLPRLLCRIGIGITAGVLSTIALEAIRYTGFRMEWMPGNLPQLMGVLITDTFMQGPSFGSDVAGYLYHFWNGACFGLIYTVLFGKRSWSCGIVYGVAIGVGFLASPAVPPLGVGFMGLQMPSMPITVILAHIAYGAVLGILAYRWQRGENWFLQVASAQSCGGLSNLHTTEGTRVRENCA